MMKTSTATLAAILLLGLAAPASAQTKPALPVGEWGGMSTGQPSCAKPFLKIEPGRIIQRLDEGSGYCKVTSLKPKSNALQGKYDCKWDDSVPEGFRENPDEDDDGSFSLVIESPTRILYNNNKFGLCPAKAKP